MLLFILCGFIFSSQHNDFILKESSEREYTIDFSIEPTVEYINKGEYTSVISSEGYTSIIGMPKLPLYSTSIMLDPTKNYSISYKVISSRIINDVKIIPNQPVINGLERETISDIDYNFYNSDRTYPYVNVYMSDPMICL